MSGWKARPPMFSAERLTSDQSLIVSMQDLTVKNILQGKNIRLRAPEPEDVDVIHTMENDPSIWQFGNTLIPYSQYQIRQYVLSTQHDIYTEKQVRMMIVTSPQESGNKVVGTIDLFEFDPYHQRAGIGILIIPEERNKGYAAEALDLLISYAFRILGLHQLFCNITPDNQASIRLFEKAGFVNCGLKKEWRRHSDDWVDELTYQLLNK